MEQIEGSETLAYIYQTPGNYPKENLLYSEHGESLKSRKERILEIERGSTTGLSRGNACFSNGLYSARVGLMMLGVNRRTSQTVQFL
jgi:hypothetical protein